MVEFLPTLRVGWSGFCAHIGEPENCGPGWSYRVVSVAFGWWALQARWWSISEKEQKS